MAYISQYEADMAQQNRANQGINMAIDGFQGIEENRLRALANKKAQFAQDMQFAALGVTPTEQETNEMTQTGYSGGLLSRLSEPLKAKQQRELELASLDKQLKQSQIEKNNKYQPSGATKETPAQKQQRELDTYEQKKSIDAKAPLKNQAEFNSRMKNIMGEAEQVKSLIDKHGTYEATGSHNNDLSMKIDSIAIDAAKLFDPESVARESEVAAFKKMLFEPGTLTTRNSTAIDTVSNFQKMIQDRALRMNGQQVGADNQPVQAPQGVRPHIMDAVSKMTPEQRAAEKARLLNKANGR